MRYQKPVINAIAPAQEIVQGGSKGGSCHDQGNTPKSAAAYEVDE